MSDLRQTTLDLLELVQTVSGYPAVVTVNRALATTAALRMARGVQRVHAIEYNPDLAPEPDYYVAVQCGQIIRAFGPPPAEHMDLAFVPSGMEAVLDLVKRDAPSRLPGVPPERIAAFAAKLYHGLMLQLRSIPVELRVEVWIREAFSEFAGVQRAVVLKQLDENTRGLALSVRARTPERIFKATMAMNAAAAQYWAGELLAPELAKPYAREGLAEEGARLLALWRKIPAESVHDRALIDAWAHELQIAGWYAWVPYDAPS